MADENKDQIPKGDSKKTQVIEALNRMFMVFMTLRPGQEEFDRFTDDKERIHELITEI